LSKQKAHLEGDFISGLELSETFYSQEVKPILQANYPQLRYTAALIGSGSEVLGFDDKMSTDHHWGPRVMLFLLGDDYQVLSDQIIDCLSLNLPYSFKGYPTNFSDPVPEDPGTRHLSQTHSGPINHRVELYTFRRYFTQYVGLDITGDMDPKSWLMIPQQKLRSITAGEVFHDGINLASIRQKLRWYPRDIWLYLMASCWSRIGQEEHLTGRAGYAGDEIGSSIIASRIIRDLMRLAFLMEKVYPPYAKWFGTAFHQLDCASTLGPVIESVAQTSTWQARQPHLGRAYEILQKNINRLDLTDKMPDRSSEFWGRPFQVIRGEQFADALRGVIEDKVVREIAGKGLIGNVDLISDNTDLFENPVLCRSLISLYH